MDLERLAKATILNTATGERIPVMYNPEELRLEAGNHFAEVAIPGLDAPPVQYVRGRGRTLQMELFFDSYEKGEDVRRYSGRIVALLEKIPRTQAPPVLLFSMGQLQFRCVLVQADQRFTMFRRDGTPVRAKLAVSFKEYVGIEVEIEHGLFVGPPTLHNVTQRQTLDQLASEHLGDPARWREIAEANDIDDPFDIPPGRPLVIPGGGGGER